MKIKIKLLTGFIFCALFFISLKANALSASMSYNIFYSPSIGSYVETNLMINAATLKYQKLSNGSYRGSVNITIMFMQGEKVANYSKIRLDSPVVKDTMAIMDFLDHQRFLLPDGTYELIISMADEAFPKKEYVHKENITIDFATKKVAVSSIELLNAYGKTADSAESKFTKNGYDLIPKVLTFYSPSQSQFSFYCEVYHTDDVLGKNEPFLISYYLQGFESKHKMNNFSGFKRAQAAGINPLLVEMNITDLASGNYELEVEVRDKNNTLLAQNSIFFQRSNPNAKLNIDYLKNLSKDNMFTKRYTDVDTLREYISWLYPRASHVEKQFIFNQAKTADVDLLQRFLYSFWEDRDEVNPEKSWLEYRDLVLAVNKDFRAGRIKGYQTDRGRVYLQYGPPSVIVDRSFDTGNSGFAINPDNSTYQDEGTVPYQIWQYDIIDNQRNRTFVFANKHIAAQLFDLIHSDAQGEFFNPQWQTELSRRRYNPEMENKIDKNSFDGQSGEFYRVPY